MACSSIVPVMALVSGNGTNLAALIGAEQAGRLGPASIRVVVSDRAGAYALTRAKNARIEALVELPRRELPRDERRRELSERILARARERDIGLIVLAGFLSILTREITGAYAGRIINLHPSLLPQFGGEGMYGEHVHRAVIASGERESGCTVHFVDEGIDRGPIILQRKVPVLAGDSPESLAERIHREEHAALAEAVSLVAPRLAREAGAEPPGGTIPPRPARPRGGKS
ncbi:MAG: phosphoribosylglycinamide formyltransferase [Spirochaetaceae bacterium]|jgi:phosphoribosylglycinamide formyltransferase-1|nr:phosphoribosylglycinamide formyltransferase [Spirochaetaceae bacterium]